MANIIRGKIGGKITENCWHFVHFWKLNTTQRNARHAHRWTVLEELYINLLNSFFNAHIIAIMKHFSFLTTTLIIRKNLLRWKRSHREIFPSSSHEIFNREWPKNDHRSGYFFLSSSPQLSRLTHISTPIQKKFKFQKKLGRIMSSFWNFL